MPPACAYAARQVGLELIGINRIVDEQEPIALSRSRSITSASTSSSLLSALIQPSRTPSATKSARMEDAVCARIHQVAGNRCDVSPHRRHSSSVKPRNAKHSCAARHGKLHQGSLGQSARQTASSSSASERSDYNKSYRGGSSLADHTTEKPARKTQHMPSRTRRSFGRGIPRGLLGPTKIIGFGFGERAGGAFIAWRSGPNLPRARPVAVTRQKTRRRSAPTARRPANKPQGAPLATPRTTWRRLRPSLRERRSGPVRQSQLVLRLLRLAGRRFEP